MSFLNLTASNLDVVLRNCLPYLIPGLSLPLDKRSNSSYACNDTEVWGQCRAELCVANVSLLQHADDNKVSWVTRVMFLVTLLMHDSLQCSVHGLMSSRCSVKQFHFISQYFKFDVLLSQQMHLLFQNVLPDIHKQKWRRKWPGALCRHSLIRNLN